MFLVSLLVLGVLPSVDSKQIPATEMPAIRKAVRPCPKVKLETILYGHFLSPASDDALVSTTGCEAHVDEFGGSALLTRKNGEWQKVWYQPGLITDQCMKVNEVPVCTGGHEARDEMTQVLYTVDFGKKAMQKLIAVIDTRRSCAEDVENGRIDRVTPDSAGLTVQVSYGKKKPTPAEKKQCEADPGKPHIAVPLKTYNIHFVKAGPSYTVDGKSLADFRIVNADF